MFVRKKPNKSGSTSVQIIDKTPDRYKTIKTIGSPTDPQKLEHPVRCAHQWLRHHLGQSELEFHDEKPLNSCGICGIQQLRVTGPSRCLAGFSTRPACQWSVSLSGLIQAARGSGN